MIGAVLGIVTAGGYALMGLIYANQNGGTLDTGILDIIDQVFVSVRKLTILKMAFSLLKGLKVRNGLSRIYKNPETGKGEMKFLMLEYFAENVYRAKEYSVSVEMD